MSIFHHHHYHHKKHSPICFINDTDASSSLLLTLIVSLFALSNINLLFIASASSLSSIANNISTQTCYRINDTTWRLVWEEQFRNETQNFENETQLDVNLSDNLNFAHRWTATNDTTKCTTNDPQAKVCNCNLARNIYRTDGLLAMIAVCESYLDYNYTGATLISKRHFGYGRLEICALQPPGNTIRTSIVLRNVTSSKSSKSKSNSSKVDQINVLTKTMDTVLYRDAQAGTHYERSDLSLFDLPEFSVYTNFERNRNNFHIYGVEWTAEDVTFIFDHHRSAPIRINASVGLREPLQLQLKIGVGGRDFGHALRLDPEQIEMQWACPALIIDYVRFYESMQNESGENQCILSGLPESPPIDISVIERICAQASLRENHRRVESIFTQIAKNWKNIFLSIAIAILCVSLIYLVALIVKMRQKISADKRDPFAMLNAALQRTDNEFVDGKDFDMDDEIYDQPIYDRENDPDNDIMYQIPLYASEYLNMYDTEPKID